MAPPDTVLPARPTPSWSPMRSRCLPAGNDYLDIDNETGAARQGRSEETEMHHPYTTHRLAEYRQAEMLADARRERLLSSKSFEVPVSRVAVVDGPSLPERIALAMQDLLAALRGNRPAAAG